MMHASLVSAKMLMVHLRPNTQSCCGSNAGFHSDVPVLPVHGNRLRSLEQKSIETVRC